MVTKKKKEVSIWLPEMFNFYSWKTLKPALLVIVTSLLVIIKLAVGLGNLSAILVWMFANGYETQASVP